MCAFLSIAAGGLAAPPSVVINEVHYHPADDSRSGEFIELHNRGLEAVDVGDWIIEGGVRFTLPRGTAVPPGGFLVIAADSRHLVSRYDLDPSLVLGDFDGTLENAGELLELWTPWGYLASFLQYGDSDPWPETPDGLGPSLERLSPLREEGDPQAWAPSIPVGGTPGLANSVRIADEGPGGGQVVEWIPWGADWQFFRGRQSPPPDWADVGFNAASWESGPAGFGYGDDDDATVLGDMQDSYLTVFIRRTFTVDDPARVTRVTLSVDYDDGFIAYLNGEEVARSNADSPGYDQPAGGSHEAGAAEQFAVAIPAGRLRAGINVLALEGHNTDLGSTDLSLSPALEATLREEEPPPPHQWLRPPRDVVVNEIAVEGPGTGWVELYNATKSAVDASGRRISLEPPDRGSYILPAGSTIPSGQRLVITEGQLGFELDSIQTCILATASGDFIDGLNPRTTQAGQSSGCFPDGSDNRVVFTAPTRGAANAIQFDDRVVVNEIMYHPAEDNPAGEYVELFNRSGATVDLAGWSFTRGIDFTVPADARIEPRSFLVLARDPAALTQRYQITGVLGPFAGRLDNDAETLLLRDALGNPADRVRYADEGSWPEGTDGLGPSAELIHPDIENRYGPAWAASSGAGTPGAPNSRLVADPPPIVAGVEHSPVVPTSGESVHVIATASDERQVLSVTLSYAVDGGGGAAQVAMADDGSSDDGIPGNGVYGAHIPPRPNGAIVAFWIRAEAAGGQSVTVPRGAPLPAFLYQVEDAGSEEIRPKYRVVLRAADLNELRTRGVDSDDLLDATFIADGQAWYNRGIRYRGASARRCSPMSYRIDFDHDRDFHGIKRLDLNGCRTDQQWIGLDFLRRTGVPTPATWFRRLSLNGQEEADWHLRVEAVDDAFLARAFPGDEGGNLYRGVANADLDYRGEDFGDYRGSYRKVTNEQAADYSDVADLSFRFDRSTTSDQDFPAAADGGVDAGQWALYFAAYAFLGSTENSILLDNGDDYYLYHRPSDGRWVLLPWDLDSCFDEEDQRLFRPTTASIVRFLTHPYYAPIYWCHIERLLSAAFETSFVNSRIDHLVPLFAAGRIQGLRTYATQRHAFIAQRLRQELAVASGSGASVCNGTLYPSRSTLTLTGQAPGCGTTAVLVQGVPVSYDPVSAAWSGSVNLQGSKDLDIVAVDRSGAALMRLDLEVDEVAAGVATDVHEQAPGTDFIAVKAAQAAAITDPDGDGNVWQEVAGVGGALGPDGSVLKAPGAGNLRTEGQSHAVYRLRFLAPGIYRGYYRARGFDQNSDSFFRPGNFNSDPTVVLRTSQDGAFTWVSEGDFNVTQASIDAGVPLELRLGVREFRTELDAFVFSRNLGLTAGQLDALPRAGSSGMPPRARITVVPSTEVSLTGGLARVFLDGTGSHDGRCSLDGLSFLWSKVEGPAGDAFEGDVRALSIQIAFSSEGVYRYRLAVSGGAGGQSDVEEVTITVLPGPQGNAFMRCDSTGDGENNITDAIFTLRFLFMVGDPSPCAAALNCNADAAVNLTDPIFNLNFLFLGGPRPGAPFPLCETAPVEACATATCAP